MEGSHEVKAQAQMKYVDAHCVGVGEAVGSIVGCWLRKAGEEIRDSVASAFAPFRGLRAGGD